MATLSHRKQVIAVKVESTEGTDAVPDATDAQFFQFNAAFNPDVEQHERNPFRTTVGSLASVAGVKRGTVTFESELSGVGTGGLAPPLDAVLQGCDMEKTSGANTDRLTIGTVTNGPIAIDSTCTQEVTLASGTAAHEIYNGLTNVFLYNTSGTWNTSDQVNSGPANFTTSANTSGSAFVMYRPKTTPSPTQSVTIYHHIDGLRHKLVGCRGNMKLVASTSGAPVRVEFEFVGKHSATDDSAILSPTYPTTTAPTFKNASFVLHPTATTDEDGYSGTIDSLELDLGNEVEIARDANDASGLGNTTIVSRSGSGSIDPQLDLVAQHDFFDKLFTNTVGSLSFVVGDTSGNRMYIQAPRAQYASIGNAERTGIEIASIDLALSESSANGDDELVLIFW